MSEDFEVYDVVLRTVYEKGRGGTTNVHIKTICQATSLSPEVITDALRFLGSMKLVENKGPWNGGIIASRTTAEGSQAVAMKKPVESIVDPPEPAPSFAVNNTVYGTQNQQVGNGNVQHLTFGVTEEQVANLIRALRVDGREDLADLVAEETDDGKQPGRLTAALPGVLTAMSAMANLSTVGQALAGIVG